jgi:hypothetical protein
VFDGTVSTGTAAPMRSGAAPANVWVVMRVAPANEADAS